MPALAQATSGVPAAPRTARRRPGGRGPASARHALAPATAVLLLVAVWQGACSAFGIPTYLLPAPAKVAESLADNWSMLLDNAVPTLLEAVSGFALGNLVAIGIAVAFVHVKALERALMPVAVFVHTIPVVAIAPVLVIMLGNGYAPKVAIAALISFFPTLVNMVRGLESVDRQQLELLRVLSASRSEVFWKVRLYAALPYLFSALKIAATASVLGAIVAEWIGSSVGLGYLIIQATYNFTTPLLFATLVVASGIAVVFFTVVGVLERLLVRWDTGAR